MSAIRQQAIKMIERMPEDKLCYLLNILKNIEGLIAPSDIEEPSDAQAAYQELRKYRRKGTADRNYRKELCTALEKEFQ